MPNVRPSASAARPAPNADKYKKLLAKVQSINIGGGNYWKPPVGHSVIRVLPPVGTMEYFFKEVGTHYLSDSLRFDCPNIASDGTLPCPLCELNEELYRAGEKEAANKFKVSRSFQMNIIDRSAPDQGVKIYAPGTTVFQAMITMVQDPDVGDISDPVAGFDVKLDRTGEGRENTKYQTRSALKPTPLSTDADQLEEWLSSAQDLQVQATSGLLSYDEMIEKAGVKAFFDGTGGEVPAPSFEEEEAEAAADFADEVEEEEEVKAPAKTVSAAAAISKRLDDRKAAVAAPTATSARQTRINILRKG